MKHLLVLSILLSIGCAGIKDIRPTQVLDGIDAQEAAKGRALLDRAAALAGGRELLSRHAGYRATFQDVWTNDMAKFMFLRYDEKQRLEVVAQNPNVDNVRMTLLNGERKGEVWGVKDDRVFIERSGKREFTDDEITLLYVKNPPALLLTPLRLAYADQVAYTGPITHKGKRYETVFVTWETLEPNTRFDQWNVWIDPDTGHIAKAHLTVREYTGGLVSDAAIEFKDYKRYGDVVVPTKIGALFSIDGDSIRTYNLEDFAWIDGTVISR